MTIESVLAICAGNSPVTGEFPTQRPVTRSFDIFFDLHWINSRVNNREAGDLRRHRPHYDVTVKDPPPPPAISVNCFILHLCSKLCFVPNECWFIVEQFGANCNLAHFTQTGICPRLLKINLVTFGASLNDSKSVWYKLRLGIQQLPLSLTLKQEVIRLSVLSSPASLEAVWL